MSISYENLSVLVVDDLGIARKFAQNTLTQLKFNRDKIFMAKNSREAMKLIHERGNFDLILCDYNLGKDEINGQQILENIKKNKLISNETVFFMVTAESNLQMVSAALEYMPDHYISKPYQPKFLSERILDTLKKKNLMSTVFAHEYKGQFKEAVIECDRILKENPKLTTYILNYKAYIFKESKQYKEAAKLYSALSKRQPDNYTYILHFAECQLELGNIETSESLLKKVLTKNSKNVKTYDLLSKIETLKKNYEGAQKYKQTALQISPNSIVRQEELATLAEKNNDMEVLEKSLRNIVKLDLNSFNRDYSRHIRFMEIKINKHFYLNEKINRRELIDFSNTIRDTLKKFSSISQKEKMNFIILDLLINLTIPDVGRCKRLYKRIKENGAETLYNHKYFYLIFEIMYKKEMFDEVKETLNQIDIYHYPSKIFEEAYLKLISNNININKLEIVKRLNESGIKNFENLRYSSSYYQFNRALEKIKKENISNSTSISLILNTAQSLKQIIEKNDNKYNLNIEKEKKKVYQSLKTINKSELKKYNRDRYLKFYNYYSMH